MDARHSDRYSCQAAYPQGAVESPYHSALHDLHLSTEHSVGHQGNIDRSRRIIDILRQGFFQEADREALLAEMQDLTGGAKVPALKALFVHAKMFSWSDRWEQF